MLSLVNTSRLHGNYNLPGCDLACRGPGTGHHLSAGCGGAAARQERLWSRRCPAVNLWRDAGAHERQCGTAPFMNRGLLYIHTPALHPSLA